MRKASRWMRALDVAAEADLEALEADHGGTPPLPPVEELSPGRQIDDFTITERQTLGGLGAIYAAEHPTTRTRVAIVVLRRAVANHPWLSGPRLRNALQEGAADNRLRHPNLVDLFAFGELPDGRPYYVLDALSGGSLRERLLPCPDVLLRSEVAFSIFHQVSDALIAVHAAGVVHRDLTPENIFVSAEPDGSVLARLLDLGVGRVLRPPGHRPVFWNDRGLRIDSPRYLAPEQLLGQPLDASADVYALGLIMYEAFTGRWPWPVGTLEAEADHHLKLAPEQDDMLADSNPLLGDLVMACLDRDPCRRPTTAEVQRALGQARRVWPAPPAARAIDGLEGDRSGAGYWFALAGAAVGGSVAAAMSMLRR